MDSELTGRTADLIVCAALGDPMSTARYEGLCAGSANSRVSGVMVCYAPTLDLLRRAALEKKNLIIAREHPYFLHGGLYYSYGTDGLEAAMRDDPVVRAKREIINANQLMVYRYASAWDQFKPKAQSLALAQALGLKVVVEGVEEQAQADYLAERWSGLQVQGWLFGRPMPSSELRGLVKKNAPAMRG